MENSENEFFENEYSESETRTKNLDSYPPNNVIPDNPKGYYPRLFAFVLPEGYSIESERATFANEAFGNKLTLKQAENLWYDKMTKVIKTHEAAHATGKAEERQKLFRMTPTEADAEITRRCNDPNHPYNDEKASLEIHQRAVAEMEQLYKIRAGEAEYLDDVVPEYHRQRREGFPTLGDVTSAPDKNRTSRSYTDVNEPAKRQQEMPDRDRIGSGEKEVSLAYGQKISDQ